MSRTEPAAVRVAVVVSHVIQYYAPWFREIARLPGIELRVFFCRNWGAEQYFDEGFGAQVRWDTPLLEGYDYEFLPVRADANKRGFWALDCPEIGEILGRFDPDVVQVFGYGIRLNWRVARWAKRNGKPLMLFSDSNMSAPRAVWKRVAKEFVVRQFYRYVDGAFCVGDRNREYHRHYGLPERRIFAGGYPVECERFQLSDEERESARREIRERHGIPADAFVVNLSAKYVSHKRQIDLLSAAHGLEGRGRQVWALLVGEGPDRRLLEEFCCVNGMFNAVLTGFVNQADIVRYYAASDAVLLASSREPYGLAISEGMVAGLPVIASDACGCVGPNTVARPGVNAKVYRCGDVQALKDAIAALASQRGLCERLGAASREIIWTRDVRVMAEMFAECVKGLQELRKRGQHL